MSTVTKNAILQAKVEGVLTELLVKTNADNVYVDASTTLTAKLASIIADVGTRAKSTDVTTEINAAISGLIGGAPETYDTLKEIADYIAEHQDVVDTLNAAIGNKADKTAFEAVKATVDGLGALATLNVVTEAELADDLKNKINAASAANHSHSNKTVLDGISADMVAEWNTKGTTYVAATAPAELAEGDLFIQIVG